MCWVSSLSGGSVPRHACTFDLRNFFTLPPEARGTFRVQSPQGVCDLRTLPFEWKLSPPICQEVVGRHLGGAFDVTPPPPHLPVSYRPDRDHYLDDLLVVMENDPGWLRSCMQLVSAAMRGQGNQVSEKSVLEPATQVKWLGKEVDLESLSISNARSIVTGLIACLIVTMGQLCFHQGSYTNCGPHWVAGHPCHKSPPFSWGCLLCERKDHILGRRILGWGCGSLLLPALQLTIREHISADLGITKTGALGLASPW